MSPNQPVPSQPMPSQPKTFKSFWPIVIIVVLSAIVGGMITYIAYNQGLEEQLSTLFPGSEYAKTHRVQKNQEVQGLGTASSAPSVSVDDQEQE